MTITIKARRYRRNATLVYFSVSCSGVYTETQADRHI